MRRLASAAAAALIAVAVGALAAPASPSAKATQLKVVKVKDDFYTPDSVRVRKGGKVRWKWTPVFNNHDVTLLKGPDGVRKGDFRSQTTSNPDYEFTKRFRKPGRYRFYCTVHPDVMQMTVRVRRPG